MDSLLSWRAEFPILERCTYLVSHSLGAMPRGAADNLAAYAASWNERGVRAWTEGWWTLGVDTADLLSPLLGVPQRSLSMHQNVTVAQAIIASCHRFDGPRKKIVISELDFPSNMYLYEGTRRQGAEIVYVPSDDPTRLDLERLLDAIDDCTCLVPISLVLFKSACIVDIEAIVARAHSVGARVVLDCYQATGTLPIDLHGLAVDFAVGGSVKWLCGGPGAAYLYVRPDLASTLEPTQVGWAAHAAPFAFETGRLRYAEGPERFQSGTPNVPALYAAREGYRIVAEIGVQAIRAKSLRLTRRLIDSALERGYSVCTPHRDDERGGTVTIDMPNAKVVAEQLLRREVIIDYRPGAGIRIAPHFYNTESEIDLAMGAIDEIVAKGVTTEVSPS